MPGPAFEQALAINRETGNRRIEGAELRNLGELFLAQGNERAARDALAQAEEVLRQFGDKHYLAFVLCSRGELERRAGDLASAGATAAEARSLAIETCAGQGSELGRKVAALAEAVEATLGRTGLP